jgi:hypothetical protein
MERSAKAAVPAIYEFPEMAEEGGLMSYGQRLSLSFRQLATLVEKIGRSQAGRLAGPAAEGFHPRDQS